MICNRQLTTKEQLSSQKSYYIFNISNGASYMCLGETVLILFALQLKCSDTIIAILGAMIYFGYILLPLGKVMTAKTGAVRSQADFWVMRNVAALLVALAAPISLYITPSIGTIFIVLGAFLFYGFRAAGVVMITPLLGEICSKNQIGKLIANSWALFYASGVTALVIITLVLKFATGVWVLFSVIVTGTTLGIISAQIFRRIHETGEIKKNAQQPLIPWIKPLLKDKYIRSQILAGMSCNIVSILTIPICMLTLKKGLQASDFTGLVFSIFQFLSAIVSNLLISKIADKIGSKKLLTLCYLFFYVITLFWIIMPNSIPIYLVVIPFIIAPWGNVVSTVALSKYFLETVPKQHQVNASMLIAIGTGAISGLIGMFLGSILLKTARLFADESNNLTTYKLYFIAVLILLPVLGIFIHKLKTPPIVK